MKTPEDVRLARRFVSCQCGPMEHVNDEVRRVIMDIASGKKTLASGLTECAFAGIQAACQCLDLPTPEGHDESR